MGCAHGCARGCARESRQANADRDPVAIGDERAIESLEKDIRSLHASAVQTRGDPLSGSSSSGSLMNGDAHVRVESVSGIVIEEEATPADASPPDKQHWQIEFDFAGLRVGPEGKLKLDFAAPRVDA